MGRLFDDDHKGTRDYDFTTNRRADRKPAVPEDHPPHRCNFCGAPSWVDPSDQTEPPAYCHPEDHGEPPQD